MQTSLTDRLVKVFLWLCSALGGTAETQLSGDYVHTCLLMLKMCFIPMAGRPQMLKSLAPDCSAVELWFLDLHDHLLKVLTLHKLLFVYSTTPGKRLLVAVYYVILTYTSQKHSRDDYETTKS